MATDTWMTNSTTDALNDTDWDYCSFTFPQLSIISYFVIFFTALGFIGNVCLLLVILRRRYLRNITNILIVNLITSDILLFVTTAPIYIEEDIHPCWQFGTFGCKIVNMTHVVLHSVCMFTLAALAVERFCVVKARAGFRSKTCALGTIWTFAAILALPVLITAHMPFEGYCLAFKNDLISLQIYMTVHFLLTYLLPLIIIGYFYSQMARGLLKNNSAPSQMDKAGNKSQRKRRKLAAIVLVLVILFAIAWAPFNAFNLMAVYGGFYYISWKLGYILITLQYVMIYVYLVLNPVVVFIMSATLRRELICCGQGRDIRTREIASDEFPSEETNVDLELQQPINKEKEMEANGDFQNSVEHELKQPLQC